VPLAVYRDEPARLLQLPAWALHHAGWMLVAPLLFQVGLALVDGLRTAPAWARRAATLALAGAVVLAAYRALVAYERFRRQPMFVALYAGLFLFTAASAVATARAGATAGRGPARSVALGLAPPPSPGRSRSTSSTGSSTAASTRRSISARCR